MINDEPYLISSINDITERKRAERALKRLASFPELNPMPIVEFGENEGVTYANQAARKLFPALEKEQGANPFLSGLMAYFGDLEQGGKRFVAREIEIGGRWYSQAISLVVPGLLRIYGVDITEGKKAEAEKEKKVKQLEEFFHLTVDRENRVIQLEKRVNDLLKELGRGPEFY